MIIVLYFVRIYGTAIMENFSLATWVALTYSSHIIIKILLNNSEMRLNIYISVKAWTYVIEANGV